MRRSSRRLMTSVYKVTAAAVVVCALITAVVGGSHQSVERQSEPSGKSGFVYRNRWQNHNQYQHHSPGSLQDTDLANTIDDISDTRAPSINHEQPGRRQPACGRPLANRKPLVLDRGDQYPSSSSSSGGRSKYRPFEIRMPRIIGGDETDPGEFPWTVSVKLNGQPICGGSLIDESWILTAAHCVVGYNPRNLTVRLGAYRIKDTSETQTVDSPLSLFIVHKEYSMPRPFSNDIALLKMAEPVQYSDYIIPICLPNEDQASASGDLLQDYNRMLPAAPASLAAAAAPIGAVADGIVISTTMSDKEISRCFKRLEQNYLNSIGMGAASSIEPAAAPEVEPVAVAIATATPVASYAASGPATGGHNQQNQHSGLYNPVPPPQRLAASNHKQRGATNGGEQASAVFVPSAYDTPTYSENEIEAQTTSGGNDKISFASSASSTLNNDQFDFPMTSDYTSQTFATITNNQHTPSAHNNRNRLATISNQHAQQTNYLHHGLPLWDAQLQSRTVVGQQFDYGAPLEAGGQQKPATSVIKLTSLPISKELLREIQSVGSMQSLNLGLQQGDIVAMASDLGDPSDNTVNSQHVPTGNAANNRERVITATTSTSTTGDGTRRVLRNPARPSEFNSNDLGDGAPDAEEEMMLGAGSTPSRYSGLSGIVVGWGWVRENDNDEQVGTSGKGFQSVTLQKVRLPILRNTECEAWFRSQEKKITLLPSQFCAGFNLGGKDACRGDSGGPMIIEDNSDTGRYKLIGIVSAGIGCARPSLPGLYTRVASFLPWINAQMTRY